MGILLVANETLDLQIPFTKDQYFSLYTDICSTNSRDGNAPNSSESSDKFLTAFQKKYPNLFKDSKLDIDFQAKKKGKGPYNRKTEVCLLTIVVQGEILTAVQDVLCSGVGNDILDIEIMLRSQNRYVNQTSSYLFSTPLNSPRMTMTPVKEVTIQGFLPKINADGSTDHSVYKKANTEIPVGPNDANHKWHICVKIQNDSYICLDGLLPSCTQENRKRFLEKEKFADYKIFVQGKEILCNKIFLASMSPVMSTMFESEFKEGNGNETIIHGFSYDGVNALLKFMYYFDVSDALKSCHIALELYRAADYYIIPVLGRVISCILLEKPIKWYEVNVALALLQLAQKPTTVTCEVDQKNKVKKKMFQVLSLNIDNLSRSTLLEELYPNSDGRESFISLLEMHKP